MQSVHMHSQPSGQEHESGMVCRGQHAVVDCLELVAVVVIIARE